MIGALGPWLSAFAFTQAVEIPIYVAAARRALREDGARGPAGLAAQIAIAFGASALTHPIVWFVIPRLPHGSYEAMIVRAEVFAVVAEALYLYALGVLDARRALGWSLLANGSSAGLGFLSRWLFGWP